MLQRRSAKGLQQATSIRAQEATHSITITCREGAFSLILTIRELQRYSS